MSLKCVFDVWIQWYQPVKKQGHALVLIVRRVKSGLCRFLGDFFARKNSSSGCRWKGWKLSSSAASFPGHRLVESVTADFIWSREMFNLDTDIYGAVRYYKVKRACVLLFLKTETDTEITSWQLQIPPEDLPAK